MGFVDGKWMGVEGKVEGIWNWRRMVVVFGGRRVKLIEEEFEKEWE